MASEQAGGEQQVLLRLTAEEHGRLRWMADRLGQTVSGLIRALIPAITVPSPKVMTDSDNIRGAAPGDVVPTVGQFDKEELRGLLGQLCAATLRREIEQQVLAREEGCLTVATYKRLGRWCHPARFTQREREAKPVAQAISNLLYGRVIERVD